MLLQHTLSCSPVSCFACRNILIFPKGNREVTGNIMSLYLNVADNETAPPGWSRTAKFTLSVVDQKDPERSATKGSDGATVIGRASLHVLPRLWKVQPDLCGGYL